MVRCALPFIVFVTACGGADVQQISDTHGQNDMDALPPIQGSKDERIEPPPDDADTTERQPDGNDVDALNPEFPMPGTDPPDQMQPPSQVEPNLDPLDPIPPAAPPPASDVLQGNWLRYGYIGNCINETFWLSFELDAQVTYRFFDWCAGPDPLGEVHGSYSLEQDSSVQFIWQGDPAFARPDVSETRQRFSVGLINYLDTERLAEDVLVRQSPLQWRTERLEEQFDVDGELVLRHRLEIELEFSAELPPLNASAACQVTVAFSYEQFETKDDVNDQGTLLVAGLPCRVEPVDSVQSVLFNENLGEQVDGTYFTWQDQLESLLEGQAPSAWAIERLRWLVMPRMMRDSSSPHLLSATSADWQRSELEPQAL